MTCRTPYGSGRPSRNSAKYPNAQGIVARPSLVLRTGLPVTQLLTDHDSVVRDGAHVTTTVLDHHSYFVSAGGHAAELHGVQPGRTVPFQRDQAAPVVGARLGDDLERTVFLRGEDERLDAHVCARRIDARAEARHLVILHGAWSGGQWRKQHDGHEG